MAQPSPASPASDRPIATVVALIVDDLGRVLLVQTRKWSGLWGVPGGKIDRGETQETALRREIQEEVGLALGQVTFAYVQDIIDDPDFHKPAHIISLEFVAHAVTTTVTTNDEIAAFCWVTPDEARRLPLNRYTVRLLDWHLAHSQTRESART